MTDPRREMVARIILPSFDDWMGYCSDTTANRADWASAQKNALAKADAIVAAIVPDWWKVVPVEATHEMICAGDSHDPGFGSKSARIYRAMIDAAPPVPTP